MSGESLADYFDRTKGETERSLRKLGHKKSYAPDPKPSTKKKPKKGKK